VTFTAFKEIS